MAHQDRRSATRYPAVVDRAQVGWWEGKHFRTVPARIEDISTGGAAIAIGPESLTSPAVWMCLAAGSSPTEWVQARLAGISTAENGAQMVRLAFPLSCPYEIFKTVAWGDPPAQSPHPSTATATATDEQPDALAADRPHLAESPKGRQAPDDPPAEHPAYVVVSVPVHTLPTFCEAERSSRSARDRVGGLPWVMAVAVSLAVAVLLGSLVIEKLEGLRIVGSFLNSSRR